MGKTSFKYYSGTYVPRYSLRCCNVHSFGRWCFLVTILQAGEWARVSTPAIHYCSTYITSTGWHQDSVQHAVLGLSE